MRTAMISESPTCRRIKGLRCVLNNVIEHNDIVVSVVGGELLYGCHERHGC